MRTTIALVFLAACGTDAPAPLPSCYSLGCHTITGFCRSSEICQCGGEDCEREPTCDELGCEPDTGVCDPDDTGPEPELECRP